MIDRQFAQKFAQAWVEAWNSHDLERIMSHYADDFEMTSPFIAAMVGESNGTLKGKERVAECWKDALENISNLKFELTDVLFSVNSVVIYYRAVLGKMGAETVFFGNDGKAIKSIAHYNKL